MLEIAARCLSICTLLLLSACAMSPAQRQVMDERVEAERERLGWEMPTVARPQSGLEVLAPRPGRHHLLVVDQGVDALALRLQLIRSAQDEILFQNYIFSDDAAGLLVLNELLAAAGRGVHVRLLVDSLFSLPNPALLARLELAPANFQLRLYNPLFDRAVLGNGRFVAAILCCFRSLNHRMHNKLLVIDGQHGLVGGRNTADRYFDLDTRMNFVDLEVLVSGPAVVDMVASFDQFWGHARSRATRHARDVAAVLEQRGWQAEWPDVPARLAFAETLAADPAWLPELATRRGYQAESVVYFADPPGKPSQCKLAGEDDSTEVIHDLIVSASAEVLIQTPYFVMSPDFESVLQDAAGRTRVTISTNSLAATDAYPVYAFSRSQRERAVSQWGLHFFEAKPFPANRHQLISRYPELIIERARGLRSHRPGDPASPTVTRPGPRISLHAKILVVDGHSSIVTSHNFDPRSEIYNSENGIVVSDPAFARAMTDFIMPMTEPQNAWRVAEKPAGRGPLSALNRSLARASRRLPTLDLWPAYLTENYQLPSGVEAVEPGHPEFHDNWVSVGLAPEVVRGQRRVLTSIISRMFGFMWRIM